MRPIEPAFINTEMSRMARELGNCNYYLIEQRPSPLTSETEYTLYDSSRPVGKRRSLSVVVSDREIAQYRSSAVEFYRVMIRNMLSTYESSIDPKITVRRIPGDAERLDDEFTIKFE